MSKNNYNNLKNVSFDDNIVIHELEGVVEESQFYFGYEDEDLKHVGLYQYVLEYISFNYDY